VKDPTNPPSGYHVYTSRDYTSPKLAEELLGLNVVTTGIVMPSRKEMSEPLKKNKIVKMKQGSHSERMTNLFSLGGTNTQS
jgi:hypothetical protein